jgi:hypothetical protein
MKTSKFFLKLKLLMLLYLLLITVSCTTLFSRQVNFSSLYQPGDIYMGIRLHGTLVLENAQINGLKLSELSGLAWDEDENLLYSVSDNGVLFHLRIAITENTLNRAILVSAYPLKNDKGGLLVLKDSEDLAILKGNNGIKGDSELLISFERQPRIARFTPKGKLLEDYTLPVVLQDIKNYYEPNKALEAVTIHPRLGILTAPEWPLKLGQKTSDFLQGEYKHSIFALNGKQWQIPAYPALNSGIVAVEALDDGSILVLERAFVSVFEPFIISLRRVWLSDDGNSKVEQVAVFDSTKGWKVDNFEGLTHHKGKFFLMVSDDNNSSLQRTLLSYWELVPQMQTSKIESKPLSFFEKLGLF